MPIAPRLPFPSAALLIGALLALAACEIREDGAEQSPGQPAADDPAAAETPPAAQEPPISILREEIVPVEPIELPPEPLELVLPFADGAGLTAEAESLLREAMASEAMQEGWPVTIAGHTDSSGNDQANLRASRARAEAVAAWLVERGVADERITVIAFGEQNPIAPNARPDGSPSEAGRRANRRVALRIAPPPSPARSPEEAPDGERADDEDA